MRAARRRTTPAKKSARPCTVAYHGRVKPVVATGVAGARYAARTTRSRIVDDVVPAVSGALGSALAVLEAATRPAGARGRAECLTASVLRVPAKKSGPGKYILIGLGVVAVAGIAYAAWQTLRIDEDLWIEDLGEADVDPDPKSLEDEDEF